MTWRHEFEGVVMIHGDSRWIEEKCAVVPAHDQDACGCATPEPDPESPCGHRHSDEEACGGWRHDLIHNYHHPYVPTLCACGHGVTEATR